MASLYLTNSLIGTKEEFKPLDPPYVGLYTCGMTVYDYAHIGHGRKYTIDDILKRTLSQLGYKVKHVQNVTDVGHLTSDADTGEDKMEKGALKAGKTVWEVAQFFTDQFYSSMDKLNIIRADVICKATDHINEQIMLIKQLFVTGYAYDTPEAVYFDVAQFAGYGKIFGQKLDDKQTASREEVRTGENKRHPADFVLWFKRVGQYEHHTMHWDSPWGDGFPGWHIECSAMAMKYLGEQFDIHTGGEDHLPVHHPNEIAQSEGATGKHFVNYWLHTAHLMVDGRKMSKSLNNFYTIDDLISKDYDPLAFRYLCLGTHYRKHLNFTWEALDGSQKALNRLYSAVTSFKVAQERTVLSPEKLDKIAHFKNDFELAVCDDLNLPKAMSVVWEVVGSNIPDYDKYDLLIAFDEVLGLGLAKLSGEIQPDTISDEVKALGDKRQEARAKGDYQLADQIRAKISSLGYDIKDDQGSYKLVRSLKKGASGNE